MSADEATYRIPGACRDCRTTSVFVKRIASGLSLATILHDPGCPVLTGAVTWRPHSQTHSGPLNAPYGHEPRSNGEVDR